MNLSNTILSSWSWHRFKCRSILDITLFFYLSHEIICYCLRDAVLVRLMHSLVTSIFLYACESWTLTAELQRRIQVMEMRCYRKILRILYKDHVTNEEVRAKIQQAIGPHRDLLTTVKRRKLQWYGHVSRSLGLAKTISQGTVKGGRRKGRQRN